MSDERFKDVKVNPWDAAVILAAIASIGAVVIGTSGLMAATHQIATSRSETRPCGICRVFAPAASDGHSVLSR